jgi:hypothetical protein
VQVLYRWPSSLTMMCQSWNVNQHLRGLFMTEVYCDASPQQPTVFDPPKTAGLMPTAISHSVQNSIRDPGVRARRVPVSSVTVRPCVTSFPAQTRPLSSAPVRHSRAGIRARLRQGSASRRQSTHSRRESTARRTKTRAVPVILGAAGGPYLMADRRMGRGSQRAVHN